jgi:hypothetical protein
MRFAIPAVLLAAVLLLAPRAEAQCTGTPGTDFQRVTVRQINEIPQASVDELNTNAATLTTTQIQGLLTNPLENQLVEFTGVVLSDPYKSGLRSLNAQGVPGGIHFFVRDVTAATAGLEGMGIQIVDGTGSGLALQFFKGDEITICGFVSPFVGGAGGKTMQIAPLAGAMSATGNTFEPTDPIMQPIVVTTDDVHDIVSGQTQIDWDTYGDFNGQYVRFEGIEVIQGVAGARPDILLSSVGQDTQINTYDTSLRYRNDRAGVYPNPPFATRPADSPFVPPATGIVNLQGFLTYQGDDGGFNYSVPDPTNWVINPFEDEDFVVASAPPIVTVTGPTTVPGPADAVPVSATVVPGGAGRTIASVTLNYTYVATNTSGSVAMTVGAPDTYAGTIPAGPNGSFVIYTVTATDDLGASFTSPVRAYRIFSGPVTSLALVQETFDGRPGNSPLLTGQPAEFNLNAVVQAVFQSGTNWFGIFQDDAALAPFSGIWVFFGSVQPSLAVGDRINITQATIQENFNVTQLSALTYTVTGSGAPYAYKVVPTTIFNGPTGTTAAEQHEGMMLSFTTPTITDVNADGDDGSAGFGEWRFSTTGSDADGLRADDFSNAISPTFNLDNFAIGQQREYIRGAMYFSFSNWKLIPVALDDIGGIVTSAEGGPDGAAARIVGAFPNPASDAARVQFSLVEPGAASLRLYDVTGREVATIAEGVYGADAHTVEVSLAGLSAGVYVLRLEAGGEVATARLSVVR